MLSIETICSSRFYSAIGDSENNIITDQQGINDQFKSFYEALYTSKVNNTEQIEEFFNNLELPSIDETDKSALEGNITILEIDSAIKKLKTGKAPGPDGYPAEFYKKFSAKLTPLLSKVFEEVLDSKFLPPTMTQATISVLPI